MTDRARSGRRSSRRSSSKMSESPSLVEGSLYSCDFKRVSDEDFPMYMAMARYHVTITGFADETKYKELRSKVLQMSGEASGNFSFRTTHVVAAHANTDKVNLARAANVTVVTEEWVDSVWREAHKNNPYFHASLLLPSSLAAFECPLFHNLNFAFSRMLDLQTKEYYEILCLDNGATVKNTLKKNFTHFYVCEGPEDTRSFQYSQSKDIPCIRPGWLVESILRRSLAPIPEYEIQGDTEVNEALSSSPGCGPSEKTTPKPNNHGGNGNIDLAPAFCRLSMSMAAKFASMDDLTMIGNQENDLPNFDTTFRSVAG